MYKRIYFFDLLKFFLACCIALLHFDWHIVPQGYLAVEAFFILSGFFLGGRLSNSTEEIKLGSQMKELLHKIYPSYILCIILSFLLFAQMFDADMLLKYFLLLQGVGFFDLAATRAPTFPLWYISAYFWIVLFFIFLYKNIQKQWVLFLNINAVLLSYYIIYQFNPHHALNYTLEIYAIFPVTIYRAVGAFCLGMLLAFVPLKSLLKYAYAFDIASVGILCATILIIIKRQPTAIYDYCFIFLFALMVLLVSKSNGFLYAFSYKCKTICKRLGEISFYMYIYHALFMTILQEKFPELWMWAFENPASYLLIIIVCSSVVGYTVDSFVRLFLDN